VRALWFEASERFGVGAPDLWPLISDTARLNRAIGLRAVTFAATPRPDGGSTVVGEYRQLGRVIARWTEHAFNFVRPRRYSVLREYSVGPLLRLDGGVELTPDGDGTIVRVFAEIVPRSVLGVFLANRVVGPAATTRVIDQCRVFAAYVEGQRDNPFPQLTPQSRADERHLDELIARLNAGGSAPAVTRRLRDHIRTASDERVVGMRPFELADDWGTDRHTTLVTFLQATTVGLVKLGWDALCPNCRIPKAEFARLADLTAQAHCDTCNLAFDASFDQLVEVRFTVSPSVRDARVHLYCVGGPQITPHVVAQAELAPGDVARWPLPPDATTLRLRSPQSAVAALVDVASSSVGSDGGVRPFAAPADATVDARLAIRGEAIIPNRLQLAQEGATLVVENQLDAPAVAVLEDRLWPDTAATAALVSTLQEFRDLFSADVLAPGLQVGIERLTILFTDVAGSTRLYEAIGQARAFRVVQRHFQLIGDAVRENRGAVVKTIGDAVMAVFPTVPQALRAAFQMQRAMAQIETFGAVEPERFLRVGIHAGPCLAVTLNDRLDYFGTAVNVAARVEHEADGGEIVLTNEAFAEPGVAEVAQAECLAPETCEVQLRGLSASTGLVRIAPVRDTMAP